MVFELTYGSYKEKPMDKEHSLLLSRNGREEIEEGV